jgi:hypothetical protein
LALFLLSLRYFFSSDRGYSSDSSLATIETPLTSTPLPIRVVRRPVLEMVDMDGPEPSVDDMWVDEELTRVAETADGENWDVSPVLLESGVGVASEEGCTGESERSCKSWR